MLNICILFYNVSRNKFILHIGFILYTKKGYISISFAPIQTLSIFSLFEGSILLFHQLGLLTITGWTIYAAAIDRGRLSPHRNIANPNCWVAISPPHVILLGAARTGNSVGKWNAVGPADSITGNYNCFPYYTAIFLRTFLSEPLNGVISHKIRNHERSKDTRGKLRKDTILLKKSKILGNTLKNIISCFSFWPKKLIALWRWDLKNCQ